MLLQINSYSYDCIRHLCSAFCFHNNCYQLYCFTNIFSSIINSLISLNYNQDQTVNLDIKHTRGQRQNLVFIIYTRDTLKLGFSSNKSFVGRVEIASLKDLYPWHRTQWSLFFDSHHQRNPGHKEHMIGTYRSRHQHTIGRAAENMHRAQALPLRVSVFP